MNLFAAIDLRNQKVVRLHKGKFDAETIYGDDAVAVACAFEAAGAPWIHVVDLDAARTGEPCNRALVTAIAGAVTVPVQAGGGVRDRASAMALLDAGVRRVVLGTAAVDNPDLVEELARAYPQRIAIGLDARRGFVAVQGWEHGATVSVIDLIRRYSALPVGAFVVTDIERDGTLAGPNTDMLTDALAQTSKDVIASGGVGTLDDFCRLAALRVGDRHLAGVIAGKALYENRFSVADAIVACQTSPRGGGTSCADGAA